jgi:hypothetical protein
MPEVVGVHDDVQVTERALEGIMAREGYSGPLRNDQCYASVAESVEPSGGGLYNLE